MDGCVTIQQDALHLLLYFWFISSFLAVIFEAAMNICVQAFAWVYVSNPLHKNLGMK